jgi:hypothetical protein
MHIAAWLAAGVVDFVAGASRDATAAGVDA